MRVCLYTHPALFEPALSLTRALSTRCELHLLVEVSPTSWRSAGFDLGARPLEPGLVPADAVLAPELPAGLRAWWADTASFHLVVHRQPRSFHPATLAVDRTVARFLRSRAVELLHVDDVDVSPRLALGLPLLRRTPLVLSVHDPTPHHGERNWRKTLARRLAYPRARRFVLHHAAQREAFARQRRRPVEDVAVVALGPYHLLDHWAERACQEPSTVLFAGRLSPYKGIEVLYQAVERLAAVVPELRVVVAGPPIAGYAPPTAPELPNGGVLDVRPRYVPNSELAALHGAATVVVCPYLEATQSGVLLTAQARGRAVVASDVGGMREYLTDGVDGLLVPPGDPEALAGALARVLRDGSLRQRLEAGMRARAAGLRWDDAADELLGVYSTTLR